MSKIRLPDLAAGGSKIPYVLVRGEHVLSVGLSMDWDNLFLMSAVITWGHSIN